MCGIVVHTPVYAEALPDRGVAYAVLALGESYSAVLPHADEESGRTAGRRA